MTAAEPSSSVHGPALIDGFSLEMTGRDIDELARARDVIPPGTRIHVTFLQSEDAEVRIAAAQAVIDAGFVAVPHIAARRIPSAQALDSFLGRLRDVGAIEHLCVIGGDPSHAEGPYASALDLIRTEALAVHGAREVWIAGYPEGHPDIPTDVLWKHLAAKTTAIREQEMSVGVATQFAFDADRVAEWVGEMRDRDHTMPLRIGAPGPTTVKRLVGFARRFGVGANAMIVKKYGFSLANLVGTAGPERFVTDLEARLVAEPRAGDPSLHLYTFGGLRQTAEWARDAARPR